MNNRNHIIHTEHLGKGQSIQISIKIKDLLQDDEQRIENALQDFCQTVNTIVLKDTDSPKHVHYKNGKASYV